MKQILLFILLICNTVLFSENTLYVIVHGTWAIEANWWNPDGDFYETLKSTIDHDDHIVSFAWCGENKDSERHVAAKRILALLQSYYNKYTNIILITHSHGGNLVNLATQLAENEDSLLINIMYAMGTPVHEDYYPNMNVIGTFYNLFSYNDYIQPVCGIYGRKYPFQDRLSNLSLTLNNKQPGHSGLHSTLLAKNLAFLDYTLKKYHSDTLYQYEGRLKLDNETNLKDSYKVYQSENLLSQHQIVLSQEEVLLQWSQIDHETLFNTMLFKEHEEELNAKKIHERVQSYYAITNVSDE